MESHRFLFQDRAQAGQLLARQLLEYGFQQPLILGLPRGGVPVAYEVALQLHAPLDTLVARKIGAPRNPEFGVGAIAPGDVIILDQDVLRSLGLERQDLEPTIAKEQAEMKRRTTKYKSGSYSKDIQADTVIIVDDGLATGVTARAAIASVKKTRNPKKVIFAAPICARDTADDLSKLVNQLVFVQAVEDLVAIGYWYEDFPQTSDEEVLECLEKANKGL